MFQLRIRCSVPDATNKRNHIDLEEQLEFSDRTKKELATDYITLRRHAKPCSSLEDDRVLVKQLRKKSISIENTIPPREVSPCQFRCPVDEWFEY